MKKNEMLDNRYQILEKLGEGGMGVVYKALDLELEKEVAIKVLKPETLSDDKATAQFKKEVRLSQELRHDNIAATYDFKRSNEFPYLVMEYVEGQILTNYIYNQPNHRLDEDAFSELTNQILDGVEHAHKKGIIHRDLKSSNIMITEDGQIKIMDFGIAASLRETYSRSTGRPITISIHFASPEQINGDPPAESMDIYSLGCVFYEILSGDPPFTQGDILHQQLTKEPESIKHISAHLNSVILKCLEKRKEDRFQSVEELKLVLKRKEVGVTFNIPKAKKKPKSTPEKRRIPWFLKAVVVILFILLGTAGYLLIDYISSKSSGLGNKTQIIQKESVSKTEETAAQEPAVKESAEFQEPDHLTIQHILISFKGAPRMTGVTRTLEEAEELAKELLKRVQAGEDFDVLVKEYTNDQHPGIFKMSNTDFAPDEAAGEYPRTAMIKAFGDVSFSLRVDEVGMTEYSAETSPYGWHIIKRLK